MRGKAVILTPWVEEVQGCNEVFAGAVAAVFAVVVGAADMDGVAAVATMSVEPAGDGVPVWAVLGWVAAAVVAAAAAEGPAVDATAGVAADPKPAAGGIDTGAGGPIWLDGV